MHKVRTAISLRQRESHFSNEFPGRPGVNQIRRPTVGERNAMTLGIFISKRLKARTTVFQYGLRPNRHAYRTGMTKIREGVRNAEQVHRAIAGKITMADKYNVFRHLGVSPE